MKADNKLGFEWISLIWFINSDGECSILPVLRLPKANEQTATTV